MKLKKTAIIITALILVISVLSGCAAFKTFFVSQIEYEGNTYTHIYDWKINEGEPYESVTITQDNMELKCRLYDSSGQTDFMYCDDAEELFHNSDADLPENNVESVKELMMSYSDPKDDKSTSDPELISELCNILAHEVSPYAPSSVEYICQIGISYKGCPATNWCVNLNEDKDHQLWVTQFNFNLPDKDRNHSKLFKAPENSKLYQFVKQ